MSIPGAHTLVFMFSMYRTRVSVVGLGYKKKILEHVITAESKRLVKKDKSPSERESQQGSTTNLAGSQQEGRAKGRMSSLLSKTGIQESTGTNTGEQTGKGAHLLPTTSSRRNSQVTGPLRQHNS